MGETNFILRGTSVINVEISSDVLDRMVRSALRRRSACGPVGRFVSNAPPSSPQSGEQAAAQRRVALIRWISDELRRWSKRPISRERRAAARPDCPARRLADSFSSN